MGLNQWVGQFQRILDKRGFDADVLESPDSTRSADDAAAALDCARAQIVKSLVCRNACNGEAVLVLAGGENRVDETVTAGRIGDPIEKPDAAFAKATTGFSIGGVSPIGHRHPMTVWGDRDLLTATRSGLPPVCRMPYAAFRIDGAMTAPLDAHRVVNVS